MELHQILLQLQGEPVWSYIRFSCSIKENQYGVASYFSAEPMQTSIELYEILLEHQGEQV
jgi:hypothetical protein